MTITEALAEIKTVLKRIQSKRDFVTQYMYRFDHIKDPLEKDGGAEKAVAEALQSIKDLEDRIVQLRMAIQKANEDNSVTIEDVSMSIANWLIWRREVAPEREQFIFNLRQTLNRVRQQTKTSYTYPNTTSEKPSDIIVNVNEKELSVEAEKMKKILGELDGQLSLKNATIMLEV